MPNELYHHGVLGMKWGVIRATTNSAKVMTDSARNINTGVSNRAKGKSANAAKAKAKKMSDEALRKKINRLNMEKQYADLTAKDTSKGRAKLNFVLETAGNVLAIAAGAASIGLTIATARKNAGV